MRIWFFITLDYMKIPGPMTDSSQSQLDPSTFVIVVPTEEEENYDMEEEGPQYVVSCLCLGDLPRLINPRF
jgi:hypothetical protein